MSPVPARPRPILASFAAAAVWFLPWILAAVLFSPDTNDSTTGLGYLLLFTPVALLFGSLAWWVVGGLLDGDGPGLSRFMVRTSLAMLGLALLLQLGLHWAADGPRQPDGLSFALVSGVALGIASLPSAATWWYLAVRPAVRDPGEAASLSGAPRDAGLARALENVAHVLRQFHFAVNQDIRLGSFLHLFEGRGATREDVDRAIALMLEQRWLIPNRGSGVPPGGHCLTPGGLAMIEAQPSIEHDFRS
jgi:hypothetical protein